MSIVENYHKIVDNIKSSNREVKLITVSKTQAVEKINQVVNAGAMYLGENRVQELLDKYDQIPSHIKWHLIGHLQSNKVKYIIDKVELIHSLDSIGLAKEIDKQASKINRIMPCLVQVNIADDDNKFGIDKDDVVNFLKEMKKYSNISIKGLMTIGPFYSDPEDTRWVFTALRNLRDEIKEMDLPGISMDELSMGMSNDYMVAIEEGSSMVRVGSSIFGSRQ